MAKTLTALQERIVGRVMAEPAQTLYCRDGGYTRSIQNLINKGLIDPHCYTMVQSQHITPQLRSIFFSENGPVFEVQDIYDNCWHVFEDGKLVCKPRSPEIADRIVKALLTLRSLEQMSRAA